MATYIRKAVKADKVQKPVNTVPKNKGCGPVDTCCCPSVIVYLIEAECLNLNNSACPDWQFCQSGIVASREEDY